MAGDTAMNTRGLVVATALGCCVVALHAPGSGVVLHAAGPACEFDNVDRIVAVGDVHGAYDRFVDILKATGVIDEKQRWMGGRTHLVQTGDVTDRGPESLKALDLLQKLQGDARKAGGAVHALLGNHEVMRMLGDFRYVVPGEYEAFVTTRSEEIRQQILATLPKAEAPPDLPLGFVEMRVAFGRDGKYGKWLRTLNAVEKIDGMLFMHGGMSPEVAPMSCEMINDTIHRELTDDFDKMRLDPTKGLAAGENGPLWYRGMALQPDTFAPVVDDILAKQHATAIVVGHTVPPTRRITQRFGGKLILIDTGMQPAYMPTGRASALVIERGTRTAVYLDGREVLPSPTVSTASPEPATR